MPQFKVAYKTDEFGNEAVDSTEKISVHSDNTSDEVSIDDDGKEITESEQEERDTWTGQLDFLLSCIGYAVGLGNVWRFPYLVYENGGGVFLIPYTIFAVLCAVPLFFMEISFGQFASLSPITIWRISPLFRGLGFGMVLTTLMVTLYYNVIVAYALYYMVLSFGDPLPWTLCGQEWNTPKCLTPNQKFNQSDPVQMAAADAGTPASEEYFKRYVLNVTDSIDNPGEIRKPILLALLVAWIIVFLCLFKGVKASGKVVYFTALFPYVVLTILLIKASTLKGSGKGIEFYLKPNYEKLKEFSTWKSAANQIFYSMGAAWGVLLTMSSYNKFSNNVFRDTMVVPLINCLTSVFAGLVIFSILGFMATNTGKEVKDVVTSGQDLAFVAYPEAVGYMPGPNFWALVFFIMILLLGMDSEFTMFECIISSCIDEFPGLRNHKFKVTGALCLLAFLLGIPMCTQGGSYILKLIDWYSASYSVMFIAINECIVICWIYGIDRFCKDIELMVGRQPGFVFRFMWTYLTPATTLGVFLAQIILTSNIDNGNNAAKRRINEKQFPKWSVHVGLLMAIMSIVPFPVCAIVKIVREPNGTVWQRIKKLSQPTPKWGPSRDKDFKRYIESMNEAERTRWEAARHGLDVGRYKELKTNQQIKDSTITSRNIDKPSAAMVAVGSVTLDGVDVVLEMDT